MGEEGKEFDIFTDLAKDDPELAKKMKQLSNYLKKVEAGAKKGATENNPKVKKRRKA